MILTKPYNYIALTRGEENGVRKYLTPDGKRLPSVTTILSATADKTYLDEWRDRVGKVESDRVVLEATDIGSSLHTNLENYILRNEEPTGTLLSKILTKLVIKEGLSKIDEIWGTEISLYLEGLYAGAADAIGIHQGVPAIIDFKNSRQLKKKEWIIDYFCQGVAYQMAHNEMYGTNIQKVVIMIACREGKYQEFIIEGAENNKFELLWIDRITQYYNLIME